MIHLHTENKGKNMGLEKFNFVGWRLEIPNPNIYVPFHAKRTLHYQHIFPYFTYFLAFPATIMIFI
jgi:hypothetical protein